MFDLSRFRLQDMTACSAALRQLGAGAASIESTADRITRYLYTNLTTGPAEDPACALVRLFKTHPYGRLSPELQALVEARLGHTPANPDMKCLTLLASTGAVEGWNHPAQSSRFRAIPLSGPDALAKLPMFSQLFAQFHIDLPFLEQAGSSLLLDQYATTFNTFYVPQALGSPYVPGQAEFVVPFGIQSVFGFGGLLSTGEMFAVILFAKVPVAKDTVDLFKTFALSTKLALAPFEHNQLILPSAVNAAPVDQTTAGNQLAALQDRVATLESILAVQEYAVEIQSDRLETNLAEAVRQGQELQKHSARFETLSATSPVGIFETDADGSCLYTNTTWQTIAGLPLVDTLGDGWSRAIVEEDRHRVFAAWNQAAETGGEFSLEFRIQRPDGTIRWVHARSRPLKNHAGVVTGHVGTTEDITEQRHYQAQLQKTEELWAYAFQGSGDGVWDWDASTNKVYYSSRWKDMLGYTDQDIGHTREEWSSRIHPDDLPRAMADIQHHFRGESLVYVNEHRMRCKDGSYKWILDRGKVVSRSPDGSPLRVVGTHTDITDRKQTEDRLHRALALQEPLINHAGYAIIATDPAGLITVFNPAAVRLLGYEADEMIGKLTPAVFHDSGEVSARAKEFGDELGISLQPGFDVFVEKSRRNLQNQHEWTYLRKDGRHIPVLLSVTAIRDAMGGITGFLGMALDLTDRKVADTQFRTVLETMPTGVLVVDEAGRITMVNRHIVQMFGHEPAALLGQPIEILLPERFRAAHPARVRTFITSPTARTMGAEQELIGRRKDGTEFFVEIGLAPIHTPQGIRVVSSIADITFRKQTEATRFRLQQAINHAQDGMALFDETGEFMYMNPAHAAIYGYTVDELLGKSWTQLYPEEWAAMIDQMYLPMLHSAGQWQGEVVGQKRSGDVFHVDLSLTLLEEPGTGRQTILCTCRDISLRKQMEHDLITAKEAAEAGIRAKSEFLATMSHEIRTPMNGVLGMTGLLLDTALSAEQREWGETLRASGESLLAIINDILDYSKIEAGKLDLEPIPFDIRATLDEVLDLLALSAHRKNLELIGLTNADVPQTVVGDPGRIKQILINLTANAIKFTDQGEVTIVVSCTAMTSHEAALRIDVIDTGVGMDAAAQSRLFQSFTQADSSTARKYGGTGLGLAICKQLVELMGGAIHVESRPGQGSRFWLDIRLRLSDRTPSGVVPDADLKGKRIGLVDNHPLYRQVLAQYAAHWGMELCVADHGAGALATLRTEYESGRRLDLAILDMRLPDMSGLALARLLKANPLFRDMPLVILTSVGRRGDGKDAREAGVAAYLTKPVRERQLAECLRMVLSQPQNGADTPALITRHTLSETAALTQHHLLVVDDNPVNLKVAVKMLEKLGHRVDVAGNGREALAALTRHPYHLVFMDCQMPELDGFETTRLIRAHERTGRRLPIIALTANVMQGDRELCLASGMDDVVSKPATKDSLHRALTRWIPDNTGGTEREFVRAAAIGDTP